MSADKGLESSIEFTKHVMTLAGAGIAFVASLKLQNTAPIERISLAASIFFLAISLGAGLLVWSRAAIMTSENNYNLEDCYLKIPGLINIFSFALGVVTLGAYVMINICSAA